MDMLQCWEACALQQVSGLRPPELNALALARQRRGKTETAAFAKWSADIIIMYCPSALLLVLNTSLGNLKAIRA